MDSRGGWERSCFQKFPQGEKGREGEKPGERGSVLTWECQGPRTVWWQSERVGEEVGEDEGKAPLKWGPSEAVGRHCHVLFVRQKPLVLKIGMT